MVILSKRNGLSSWLVSQKTSWRIGSTIFGSMHQILQLICFTMQLFLYEQDVIQWQCKLHYYMDV
jgi:hypothetical protein